MQPEEKRNFWVLDATVTVRKKVCFEEPITAVEAMEALMDGDYDDIIDEEELKILGVKCA